jgi:hypothetical protein
MTKEPFLKPCHVLPAFESFNDVWVRLDQLLLLKDGWLEGRGSAPTSSGVDWLRDKFAQHYPEDLPMPFVYPTPEGGIRLEWSFQSHEITVDIDLGAGIGAFHSLSFASDEEHSENLDLGELSGWEFLAKKIRQAATGVGG